MSLRWSLQRRPEMTNAGYRDRSLTLAAPNALRSHGRQGVVDTNALMRWLLLFPAILVAQNPASVWITAPDSRVVAGASVQLTVLARDSAGRPLPNATCSWSAAGNNPFSVN